MWTLSTGCAFRLRSNLCHCGVSFFCSFYPPPFLSFSYPTAQPTIPPLSSRHLTSLHQPLHLCFNSACLPLLSSLSPIFLQPSSPLLYSLHCLFFLLPSPFHFTLFLPGWHFPPLTLNQSLSIYSLCAAPTSFCTLFSGPFLSLLKTHLFPLFSLHLILSLLLWLGTKRFLYKGWQEHWCVDTLHLNKPPLI